jgi:hypothetical protein
MTATSCGKKCTPGRAEVAAMMEFEAELAAGRTPDIEAHLARHPRIARRLRSVFEGMLFLRAAKQTKRRR